MIKIGNIFFGILFFISTCFATAVEDIKIALYDLDKQPVRSIAVGQSAYLKVSVRGKLDVPHIKINGLPSFHIEPRGQFQQVSSVNGRAQHSYEFNFLIRSAREGSYPLGPLMIDQQLYDVSTVIDVKNSPQGMQQGNKNYFLQYEPLKHGLVVGQKASLRITFGSLEPMALQNFQLPTLDPSIGEFSNMHQLFDGIQKVDGVDYYCISWAVDFVAKQPGQIAIPECAVACLIKADRGFSVFGNLFDVLNAKQQKMIYSQPLSLTIKELPATDKEVLAIGKFSDFRLFVNKSRASIDEGIALTLQINSVEYSDHIKRPAIDLPEGMKSYDSFERIFQTQFGYAKTFEYILQAHQPGSFTLPAQEFTYYDPEAEQYETLTTAEYRVEIEAHPHSSSMHERRETEPQDIFPLNEVGPWRPIAPRAMPTVIFYGLLLGLLGSCVSMVGLLIYRSNERKVRYYWDRYYAYTRAERALVCVANGQSQQTLYDIMIDFVCDRSGLAHNACPELERVVYEKSINIDVEAWQSFVHVLKKHKFGGSTHGMENIDEARQWLQRLKTIL